MLLGDVVKRFASLTTGFPYSIATDRDDGAQEHHHHAIAAVVTVVAATDFGEPWARDRVTYPSGWARASWIDGCA